MIFQIFLAALILSCSAFAADRSVAVGVLACQTGACASWGNAALKGIELAASEINRTGGILGNEVRLEVQDTRESESGAQAVAAYRKLRQNSDIHCIIGPTWGVAGMPVASVAAKDPDIILISPSVGVSDFSATGSNIFNMWPNDTAASKALAGLAAERKLKRAAVLRVASPWDLALADAFIEEFSAQGGKVVFSPDISPDARSLKSEAARIKTANADVLFAANWNILPVIARELRAIKFAGNIYTPIMDEKILQQAPEALNGAIFTQYQPASSRFNDDFRKKFGEAPGISADTGYDALFVYALAARDAGTLDTGSVRIRIARTDFEGASGHISFDSMRGIRRNPGFRVVSGSRFETLAK